MEEKKAIEMRDLPDNKIRLFRDRSPEIVPLPESVKENKNTAPDAMPESITITPMTHREAELRERLRNALDVKMKIANYEAGITAEEIKGHANDVSEYVKYRKEKADQALEILNDESLTEEERILATEEISADMDAMYTRLVSKWADFLNKQNKRDMGAFYDAEDALRENTVQIVCNNCKAITIGGEDVKITPDTLDKIHPDLIYWIVFEIESRSYLTAGEIAGFR